MANIFDFEGRGPSNTRLFALGLVLLLILAGSVGLLIAKSRGVLDPVVRVSAELINVGDGLPSKSDVKFRGVLIGYVSDVVPAQVGRPNLVKMNLKPQYVSGIPDTVTARVVPSNVFAVSSVQMVDNGDGVSALRDGAVIPEDRTLPTVLFQTTLDKFRQILAALGRRPATDSVGWLTALGQATSGRGDRLEKAGGDLNEIVNQLNTIVTDEPGPTTLAALADATAGLRDVAPDLLDALDDAVRPMKTLAEKRSALDSFLSAGQRTMGSLADGFDHQTNRLIGITTDLTPVVGVLADHADNLSAISGRLENLVKTVMDVAWNYETNQLKAEAIVSLSPSRTYVRADCPRYGDMAGPSCFTAPDVPVAPALTPSLESMGVPLPPGVSENRPNFAPPHGSVLPPEAPPADGPPPPPPLPAEADPGATPQSFGFGGNVGPVGSRQEKDQLNYIFHGQGNAATALLFAPLVRGTTVRMSHGADGAR